MNLQNQFAVLGPEISRNFLAMKRNDNESKKEGFNLSFNRRSCEDLWGKNFREVQIGEVPKEPQI